MPYHSRQLEESGPPFPLGVLVCIGLSPPSVQEGEGERKGLSKFLPGALWWNKTAVLLSFFSPVAVRFGNNSRFKKWNGKGGRKTLPQILISRQSRNRCGGGGRGEEGHFSFPARLSVSDPQANDGERTVYLDAAVAAAQ